MKYMIIWLFSVVALYADNFQLIKYDSTYNGEIEWFLNNTSANMYFGTDAADSVGLFVLPSGGGMLADSSGLNITRHLNYIDNTNTSSDIDISLFVKGGGSFQLNATDSTITGGLKRGLYSTDLQRHRDSINQISNGLYGTILGGRSNAVYGTQNTIINGYNNYISDSTDNNTILAGYYNRINRHSANNIMAGDTNLIDASDYVFINGRQNVAEQGSNYSILNGEFHSMEQNSVYNIINGLKDTVFSSNSVIINGSENKTTHAVSGIITGYKNNIYSGTGNIVGGQYNKIDSVNNTVITGSYGQAVYNNSYHLGGGVALGRHQFSIVILSGQTVADFYNELFVNGVTNDRILIDSNSAYHIRLDIVGVSSQAGSQGWLTKTFHVYRAGNVNTTTCDNPIDTTINSDPVIMSVRVNANIVDGALLVEVRNMGASARWTVVAYITKSEYD